MRYSIEMQGMSFTVNQHIFVVLFANTSRDIRMCNILRLVSLAVTQVEVFVEGVGRVFGNRTTKQLVVRSILLSVANLKTDIEIPVAGQILSLEGVKAISRLGVLCSGPPDIMLLDWGKVSHGDLCTVV